MQTVVVGLGLIGGSLALEAKQLGHHVVGVDLSEDHQKQAIQLDLVNEIRTLELALEDAQLVVLAIPVNAIQNILSKVLDMIPPRAVVVDVGSTKKGICSRVESHVRRGRFVAGHPLAGTEFSGPSAAHLNLFRNKKNIICEDERSDEDALEVVLEFFSAIGMQSLLMNADAHDKHMAYVSHLSHVSAFALGLTVLDMEKDEKLIFNLASTGFQSTVRLAKSSPDTWTPIFDQNADHLVKALDGYIRHLQAFKQVLETGDQEGSHDMMEQANEIKRVLRGMKLNTLRGGESTPVAGRSRRLVNN